MYHGHLPSQEKMPHFLLRRTTMHLSITMVVNLRYMNDSDTSLCNTKFVWEKLTGNAKKALKNSTNPSSSDRKVS